MYTRKLAKEHLAVYVDATIDPVYDNKSEKLQGVFS